MSEASPRIPPQATELEESILGTMLMEQSAIDIVRGMLGSSSEAIYSTNHRIIYEAIINLHDKQSQIDLLVVEDYLRDQGKLGQVGGPSKLADLTSRSSSSNYLESHLNVIMDKYIKRCIIHASTELINAGYAGEADAEELITVLGQKTDEIGKLKFAEANSDVKDILQESLEDIEDRIARPGITGVPTGTALDKYTGGWQDGSLYIIGARPSVGKTAFMLKGGYHCANRPKDEDKTPVMYWNGEMLNRDMVKRLLAIESRINYLKMRDGNLNGEEFRTIVEAAGRVHDSIMEFDDTVNIGIHALRAKYKAFVRKHNGKGLLIVDYLQLMAGHKEGNREQEISSIARGLKGLALETGTPVIALSQLSRACLSRNYAKPSVGDLRESGAIEQDADGIILLNRPELFGYQEYNNKPSSGLGIVDVAKMRNGMLGEIEMRFEKMYAEWRNPTADVPQINDNQSHSDSGALMPHSIPLDDDDQPF